jgi:PAS domain S-box-containing protein
MSSGIQVLHVDDDGEFLDLAATFLEREDDRIEVVTATSATEGLDRLAEDEIDCIVSDYDMPGRNGLAFLDAVRERDEEIPFVLYTGKGGEEVASEAISRGVTEYLQKAGSTDQYTLLANRIANLVEGYESKQALSEQVRRLETLVSNLPGMVYRCRNERGWPMEYVDGDCEELTGYTAAALETGEVKWGEDIIHPEARDRLWNTVQEALATSDAFEVSYRITAADGEQRWMWERGRGVYDDDGELAALEGFITDITEQKRREEALGALHEATQAFAEATEPEAVASRAVETAKDVLDQPINGVWLYDDATEALEPVAVTDEGRELLGTPPTYTGGESLSWQVFQSGETAVYEDLSAQTDRYNPETPIESEVVLPLGDHGIITLGSTEPAAFDEVDITLAELLADTTAATLERARREAALRERRRELARQNEQLDEFASVLSHDLRNPLGIATGNLEIARGECDSEALEEAAAALDRMDTFVERTLTLARSGRVVGETESVDLAALVDRCWAGLDTGSASISVGSLPTIAADPERLRHLFENLFRNSVEHGSTSSRAKPDDSVEHGSTGNRTQSDDSVEHGSGDTSSDPSVTIRVEAFEDGFYVADDGVGIPPEDRSAVLEAGYSTAEGGTGLGLVIVRRIAEAHGWTVTVTESASGGVRFEFAGVETR